MKVFFCKSEFLGKSLVILAEDKDSAGQKVADTYSDFFTLLEKTNKGVNIDIDLGLVELTEEVTEL
jgi:hypothetical protein